MSFKRIFAATMLIFSAVSLAFTPTAQQIEQFKKLPKSQQQALAKQYGFDLSSITGNAMQSSDNPKKTQGMQSVFPRDEDEKEEEAVDPMKPEQEKLKPFGYELFSGEPSSFSPSEVQFVPNDYVIASGDTLTINLYGKEAATHTLTVDREGRLNIPEFTPVDVVGLTYGELKVLIAEKIKNEAIGLKVYISIAELRGIQVLVVGESYRPGSYSLSPLANVTHALFASGGLTEISSLRNIQVKRHGKTVANLDLYDLLLKGDSSSDITLQSGDVVFIPSVGPQVTVKGQVKRPAIFELKEGESARALVHMFGGFKADAFLQRVQVNRVVNNSVKSVVSVDFRDTNIDYSPKGGDVIKVQAVSDEVVDSVSLIGAVARPGNYQWYQGITLDTLISDVKADLLPQADLSYSIIVRESDRLGQIEVMQFTLKEALTSKRIALQKNDQVYIFSRFDSQEKEDKALQNLAMTVEEKELQKSVKLWHLYERRQFENHVSFDQAIAKSKENNDAEVKEGKESNVQVRGKSSDSEEQPSVFGRTTLLAPILAQLEYQSSAVKMNLTIEVVGQVRFPGRYPIDKGMNVHSAIQAAGGLLESAHTEYAEITRVKNSGGVEYLRAPMTSIEEAQSINLQSRDTISVLMRPNWEDSYRVKLKGEVVFPGEYIVKRGESLLNVVQRAGGLTQFADPKAAIFTRESIKAQEREQIARLSEELRKDIAAKSFQKSIGSNSLSYSETNKLLNDLANVSAVGRLVIDLQSIMSQADSLTLQEGDALYVPGKRDSVSIIGEVNYSSSHLFKPGVSIEEYINLSGGVRDRADEEKIYVIKANGAVLIPDRGSWFAVNNHAGLEAGDTIVVPMDSSYMDNLTLWSTATQIFYQLGVGVAAISGI
ncbi:SLBB domain-containing protein [Pseudoalteromonas rubra]|uniref:Polysaccharide biosynthesis protein n=1 Tax=Pseudoalteromonas rubra TaxID=43658 RepID=A0A5S3WYF9_9GAMM|nr:SLBB domain-containing protein [Pseudoalteromonas rubra]TMP36622.1 polysaccharide biosynthesis protein [Pseudoalteromonas rubra]